MKTFTLINRSYLHFILLLTICSIIFSSSDIYNNSWAVIVGIDEYTGEGLKELHYAVDDAEAIRKVLIEYHNINSDNITLLLNADATKEKIEEALYNYYKQADYEDRIIFYFAGHGVTVPTADGGEMGYLVPADIKYKDQIVLKGIDMQSLKKFTNHANAKHILFLIDACYGGLAAVGSRGLEFKKVGDANWRKITKGKVRKIITAGRKNEPVIEKPEWGHSAFARNMLRGIGEDRAADLDNNNYITSEELGVYLKTKVSQDTDGEQTPQSDRLTSDDGEFVFILPPLDKEEAQNLELPTEPSSRPQYEIDNTQTIKAFENMLRRYGKSQVSAMTIYSESGSEKLFAYTDLLVGNIGFIDSESLKGKWLKLPSFNMNFNRISGLQVGLKKEVTSLDPFTYLSKSEVLYSHARKDVDYSVLFKRYLLNKTNHTLSARYSKEVKSNDNWTVNYPRYHRTMMAFLFNMDQMDHFLSEGYSMNHHYYDEKGFSTNITFINNKQTPIEKHSDFSLVAFMADYRENYFSSDSVFSSGQLSSISMDFGIFGATDEYRLADNRIEIKYKLNDLDIPFEYHLNYNKINFPSDTLFFDTEDNPYSYNNKINTFIDTNIVDPNGSKNFVRRFIMDGDEFLSRRSIDVLAHDHLPVKGGKTYIYSVYVRTISDTANINLLLKDNSTGEEYSNRNWHINSEWSRIWIKKTFNNKNEDEPKAWININGPRSIYLWGLQLEEAEIDQEEPREYVSTDGNWSSDIEVFLVCESPNWGWKSIKLLDEGHGNYSVRPLLVRGIYAYRLQIGDNLFLDPNTKKTSRKVNGDEVSIITIGSTPKINIGLEYSSPDMGSDFEFTKMTYNIRHSFPLSYYETVYMRLIGGVLEGDMQPIQKQFYLGNVGTLRGYNVKEFTGNKMILFNLEYHINLINKIFSWIPAQINGEDMKFSDLEYSNFLYELFDEDEKIVNKIRNENEFIKSDPIFAIKPFLFYDVGLIGNHFDEDNIYHSAGIGINIYGLQFIMASRLDRDTDNWSVLFDFAGFFGRENYLPK